MASRRLAELWNGAMAAKSSDWTVRGVVRGPRHADPNIGASWVAWATGPNGERLQGDGASPQDAFATLMVQL